MEEKLNYKMAMAEIESIVSKLEDNKLDISLFNLIKTANKVWFFIKCMLYFKQIKL